MHVSPFALVRKRDVLHGAWRKVRENGLKSLSPETRDQVLAFDADAAKVLRRISDQLRRSRFQFAPQWGVAKKRKGKAPRPLVVGAIQNRIVQRAILDVLQGMPCIAEVLATPTSVGGVPERGREHAIALVCDAMRTGATHYIRSDIEGFFRHIPRRTVLDFFSERIDNAAFVELIQRATNTELANAEQLGDDALLFPIGDEGVAQGCPLSPLMGNILLNTFDVALNGRGITCVRYIDDFILLGPNALAVSKAFQSAQNILGEFGLAAYDPFADSSKAEAGEIRSGFNFLGCQVSPGLVQPSRVARANIVAQCISIVAEGNRSLRLAAQTEGLHLPKQRYVQTLSRLDRTLRGWGHAFAFCTGRQTFEHIDREVDGMVKRFREFAARLAWAQAPEVQRRVLGVHLLADTRVRPLPDVAGHSVVRAKSIGGTEHRQECAQGIASTLEAERHQRASVGAALPP
jgi:RNA-directed DNA polymerase